MFGHVYFGARYFAPRYFGDGGSLIPPDPTPTPPTGGGGSSPGPVYYERKQVVRLRKKVRKAVEEAVEEQPYGHLFGYDELVSIAEVEVRKADPGFMSEVMIHEIAERAIKGIHAALLKRQADEEEDDFLLLVS